MVFDFGSALAYSITRETLEEMAKLTQIDYGVFHDVMWSYRWELDLDEHTYRQFWENVLKGCNSPANLDDVVDQLTHLDITGFGKMNQKMLNWAKSLKENSYRTIIISNMSPETYQALTVDPSWLTRFDELIISGHIKINKPNARIYKKAIRKAGVAPSQILFLDDVEKKIVGAQKMGINAHHFSDTDTLLAELKANYPSLPRQALHNINLSSSKVI